MPETIGKNELGKWFSEEHIAILENSAVVLMAGFNGTGKSNIARTIKSTLGGEILRSDEIRQQMFPGSGEMEIDSSLYEQRHHAVYEHMRAKMILTAQSGGRAIVDATHLNNERQKNIARLGSAGILDASVIVLVETHQEVVRQRQRRREGSPNGVETWEQAWDRGYKWFKRQIEEGIYTYPSEGEGIRLIRVTNS